MAQYYSVVVCIAGLVDEYQLRLSSGSLSVLFVYHLVPEGREGEGLRVCSLLIFTSSKANFCFISSLVAIKGGLLILKIRETVSCLLS